MVIIASSHSVRTVIMKKCDDTISRQMVIDAIMKLPAMPPQKKFLAEIKIDGEELQQCFNKAVDTILQQIIHCKDCRFFNEEFHICGRPHGMSFSYLKEDDYCSYAEEKG